jgi:hypothetical protein
MANCDEVNHNIDIPGNRFTIRILRKNSKTICYIKNDKTIGKLYFQNLVKLIERPTYRVNCKQLINEFNGIIKSLD